MFAVALRFRSFAFIHSPCFCLLSWLWASLYNPPQRESCNYFNSIPLKNFGVDLGCGDPKSPKEILALSEPVSWECDLYLFLFWWNMFSASAFFSVASPPYHLNPFSYWLCPPHLGEIGKLERTSVKGIFLIDWNHSSMLHFPLWSRLFLWGRRCIFQND